MVDVFGQWQKAELLANGAFSGRESAARLTRHRADGEVA